MKEDTVKRFWVLACTVVAFFWLISALGELSARAEKSDMPGIIVIKDLQKRYGPVSFDHSMHASLAGECGTCHHMHNKETASSCGKCHSIGAKEFKASVKQTFLPCSACHTDLTADSPEMPSLKVALHKKCFQCHVGIGGIGSSPEGCVKTCHSKQ
ncbi:MAG: cytochrome c3 family protein [Dissulfurispiraceae bacterium]